MNPFLILGASNGKATEFMDVDICGLPSTIIPAQWHNMESDLNFTFRMSIQNIWF